MTAMVEFLFPAPAERRPSAILSWWERRRGSYNLVVGAAGLMSVSYVALLQTLVWREPVEPGFLLVGSLVFGVGANVCYSLGPLLEVALEKLFGRRILPVGPTLYRMGLTFSVGLALFPALIATFALVGYTVASLLGLT